MGRAGEGGCPARISSRFHDGSEGNSEVGFRVLGLPRTPESGHRARLLGRRCAGAHADRRRQEPLLPDPGPRPRRCRRRRIPAHRPHAGPGRCAPRARSAGVLSELEPIGKRSPAGRIGRRPGTGRSPVRRSGAARDARLSRPSWKDPYRSFRDRRGPLRQPVGT